MAELRIGDKIPTPRSPRDEHTAVARKGAGNNTPGRAPGNDSVSLDGRVQKLARPPSHGIDSEIEARSRLQQLRQQIGQAPRQASAAHGDISQALADRLLARPPA